VSTILEALRLREPRLTPAAGRSPGWTDVLEWALWRWALVVGLAAAAVSLPLVGSLVSRPEPTTGLRQPPPLPVPVTPPAAAPAMRHDEPPRARVERRSSARPAASAVPAAPPAPVTAPPPAPAVPNPEPGPQAAAAPAPPVVASAASGSEPVVRLRSIGYGDASDRRTATLAIDGAQPVTLRQGESASGIEVQLILRDSVYVRHGPDVFAVEVER
jgi:hypothetical protein